MMSVEAYFQRDFGTLDDLIRLHAGEQPDHPAVIGGKERLTWRELDALVDRIAAALQRDGLERGAVAICAQASIRYVATFLGTLRAGGVAAPLAPTSTPQGILAQIADCGARFCFVDAGVTEAIGAAAADIPSLRIALDGSAGGQAFEAWLAPEGARPVPAEISPDDPFNMIYSSGTTGTPKGIVQPHRLRWAQLRSPFYTGEAVTLISTPLYSNTTLVSVLPTLARGGTVIVMPKFDVQRFLQLSQEHRVTHVMLVPVQYRRIMEWPGFGDYDLSSYVMKFCTSAPFAADLKADVLKRWPGGLVEYYGMTEGGGSCVLKAHEHPDKLHTVGQPSPDHDIRLLDPEGREVATGEVGEVVGRSRAMMIGYHNQPAKTREAEWYSPEGDRFIRTGDLARFDDDGFLTLIGRAKDMIISGGFNIYPSDLESVLLEHPAVKEAAVVGVPSKRWGETPVAFVTLEPGQSVVPADLQEWLNARVSKLQRVADLTVIDQLPRSPIGKVLKRELRDLSALATSPDQ